MDNVLTIVGADRFTMYYKGQGIKSQGHKGHSMTMCMLQQNAIRQE